jgi:hypothetical protein
MTSSNQPLLVLGEDRIQDELRRAATVAADFAAYQRRNRRLVFICLDDFMVGLATIALSIHMALGDWARVVFYVGFIRALCFPMWTVILTLWLEDNGWQAAA